MAIMTSADISIFVSHSSRDNAFGTKLVQDLREAFGNENAVWYDSKGGLHGGDIWWDKIKEELRHRYVFIVILSPSALVSPWVGDEIRMAWRQRNSPQGKYIIPLLCQPCEIPDDLDTLQVISFAPPKLYEDAFNELLVALSLPVGMEKERDSAEEDLVRCMTAQIKEAFHEQNWQKVIEQVKRLIQQAPRGGTAEIYRLLGLAFHREGDLQAAEETFQTAFSLTSDSEQRLVLLDEYTQVLTQLERWREALRNADEAMRLEPNNPHWMRVWKEAHAHLGPGDAPVTSQLPPLQPKKTPPLSFTYQGHMNWVYGLAWSPDSKYLASASTDHSVHVWEAITGSPRLALRGHTKRVNDVAWSPDGTHIATASNDKTVQIWDATSGVPYFTYRGHNDWVNAISWSPDGTHIASASDDKTVQVWNAANGDHLFTHHGHFLWVNAVLWSLDGKRIASASSDKTVQIWDASTGANSLTYRGHSGGVHALLWSPRGRVIASASSDKTVHLWDPLTGHHSFTYSGHKHPVLGLARSPHGRRIASTSGKGMQVWYAATGDPIFTADSHADLVRVIAWSPNGKYIASAGDDKTVQVRTIVDAGLQ